MTQQAQGNNLLFGFQYVQAQAEAALTRGERQIWIAPIDADGQALVDEAILLRKLAAGDTGPTPEAVTEDITYDNGDVVQSITGENLGSKTWALDSSAEEPDMRLILDHHFKYGTAEKKGKAYAFWAFNFDRSCHFGAVKTTTASAPREGRGRWEAGVTFAMVDLRRPSQNPVAGLVGDLTPTAAMTPETGPVGTVVRFDGEELTLADAVYFGAVRVERAAFAPTPAPTATRFDVAVPAGLDAGDVFVELDNEGTRIPVGSFTVTA